MIAQDQFAGFNEEIKKRIAEHNMNHQHTKDRKNKLVVKTGYKEGIIRIWQKLSEYERIS